MLDYVLELPINMPVMQFIYIGNYKQPIVYEGEGVLYKFCGRLGHVAGQYNFLLKSTSTQELLLVRNQ